MLCALAATTIAACAPLDRGPVLPPASLSDPRAAPEATLRALNIRTPDGKSFSSGDVIPWTFPTGYTVDIEPSLTVAPCNRYALEYEVARPDGTFAGTPALVTGFGATCFRGPQRPPIAGCDPALEPFVKPPQSLSLTLNTGRDYNFRVRAQLLGLRSYVDNGTLTRCTEEGVLRGQTPWVYFAPTGAAGVSVAEDWRGEVQVPLDFSDLSGSQLNEIGDNLSFFPDGRFTSFRSSAQTPYRVEFGILALRTATPERLSDGSFGFMVKASRPCSAKVSAVIAADFGKREWQVLATGIPVGTSLTSHVLDFGSAFRRYLIRSDGENHQLRVKFECVANAPFQLDFDVMGTSYMALQ